jgi:uncharacterized protein (TIGR02246 family)
MRSKVACSLITGVLAVLLGSCALSQKPVVDSAGIKTTITGINQRYVAAVQARDLDAVVSLYSDDAKMLPAGAPASVGHEAIKTSWEKFLQTPGLNLTFSSNDMTVSEAGDMVIDIGAYQMSTSGPKGEPTQEVGKYVTVFKKVGDEWKIAVDTFNSDTPPTALVASK